MVYKKLPDVYLNMEPPLHSTATELVSTFTNKRRAFSTGKIFLNKKDKAVIIQTKQPMIFPRYKTY